MLNFNFCPRCGHALEMVERDDARLRPRCPNCHYTHYANPSLAVGVVVADDAGRVCLILRGEEPRKGYWGLPAGFMEGDETAENAAVRECAEETGLTVELDGLLRVYSYQHADHETSGVLVLYRAHITGGTPQAGTDTTDVRVFSSQEIPFPEMAFATHVDALELWQREQKDS